MDPWQTSSQMFDRSKSAASDVKPGAVGLRIVRGMQPSAARGKTAECVAQESPNDRPSDASFSLGAAAPPWRLKRESDRHQLLGFRAKQDA
jgi:hypothetical protein